MTSLWKPATTAAVIAVQLTPLMTSRWKPATTATVIAVQLFKGRFFYCNDDSKNTEEECRSVGSGTL